MTCKSCLPADAPMMPLFNGLDVGVFRDTVQGYTPWALKRARVWEVSVKP